MAKWVFDSNNGFHKRQNQPGKMRYCDLIGGCSDISINIKYK